MLNGMTKRMTEIQDGPAPCLALVLGNDRGLDLATTPNRVGQRVRVPCEQPRHVGLEPLKERQVANRAVLDDFGQAG